MEITFEQDFSKKIGKTTTDNATYCIEVERQDGTLISVTAQVKAEERSIGTDGINTISVKTKGTINYNNGKVSFIGFPLDEKLPIYATEFNELVAHIEEREA